MNKWEKFQNISPEIFSDIKVKYTKKAILKLLVLKDDADPRKTSERIYLSATFAKKIRTYDKKIIIIREDNAVDIYTNVSKDVMKEVLRRLEF